MFKRLKIPFRNVLRNKRRTAFSLIIIAMGVAILLATLAFTDEAITSTKSSLANDSGSVQVAAPELFKGNTKGYDYLIRPDKIGKTYSLIEEKQGVVGATSRLELGALMGTGDNETSVVIRGIVPENCVQDYRCIMTEGDPLSEESKDGIVLGGALADKLSLEVGESLEISLNDSDGNYKTLKAKVRGLASLSSQQLEGRLAFAPLSFVQEILSTKGVGRIIVRLEDVEDSEEFAADLQKELDNPRLGLETRTWQQLNPVYDSLSTFWNAFSGFTYIAVFTLVFFSTLEVLTMSFLERTKEVGTIKAVGTTGGEVFRDFLVEGGLIGTAGGILGLVVGVLIGYGINLAGITWKPPGASIPEPLTIRFTLTTVAFPFLAAVFSTALGSVFPAWKNSRIKITEALRGK